MKQNERHVNGKQVRRRGRVDGTSSMILAGDVGGTKTLLGIFDPVPSRPRPAAVREFSTLDHHDLGGIVREFLEGESVGTSEITAACFGVAGPVVGNAASLTNVPWHVDGQAISRTFGIPKVAILNDLQAMAHAVPLLEAHELQVLQRGEGLRGGNLALIAAGTGLGEALIHYVDGRFIPSPSEAGHADFAARTDLEIDLLRDLRARLGRVDVERVVSGQGLVNVYRVTHRDRPCRALVNPDDEDAPAAISTAALEGRCPDCARALEAFVEAYGAEAGNLALRTLATGGVFIGGGIAPKILPALTDGRFMEAFLAKAPMDQLLVRVPVNVILNERAGLLGAAVFAAGL